uniref:HDC15302 n=1 Tax=Drosophila melanogaster TaxID=7227 RepID=Q6IJB7_DROME|nr:TPA_inf: HDC15302 [Drosophila melanogaster]
MASTTQTLFRPRKIKFKTKTKPKLKPKKLAFIPKRMDKLEVKHKTRGPKAI